METLELNLIQKRLSKYSAEQLQKKLEMDAFSSPEEKEICESIISKRTSKTSSSEKTVIKAVEKEVKTKKIEPVSNIAPPPVVDPQKELSLLDEALKCLDKLFEKNDIKINKRILDVFGDEDVEDYSQLSEVQLIAIIQIHKEIFTPERIVPVVKPTAKNAVKAITTPEVKSLVKEKQVKVVTEKLAKEVKEKPVKEHVDSKTYDITSEAVKVGDKVEFDPSSRIEGLKDTKLTGEVIKVYFCGKTLKEYVRLKSADKVYHKRLSYFTK
jgi:hypothetical protein